MSLALLHGKQQVRVPRTSAQLQLRIGIHTGNYFIYMSIKFHEKNYFRKFFFKYDRIRFISYKKNFNNDISKLEE